jgi:transposase InsO family protein
MVDAQRKSAYILCITDAFTKYAVVTSIPNKDAQTVAKAIFEQWFCKFGIPAQIHTDGGKEFVNKLLTELCELLNIQQTKTTPYHPQCNAQVEVFNKTVKKYLASYVDETTLNWDEFLTIPVTTPRSPLHHLNYFLVSDQDYHRYQRLKFKEFNMVNLFQRRDCNYCSTPDKWLASMLRRKV